MNRTVGLGAVAHKSILRLALALGLGLFLTAFSVNAQTTDSGSKDVIGSVKQFYNSNQAKNMQGVSEASVTLQNEITSIASTYENLSGDAQNRAKARLMVYENTLSYVQQGVSVLESLSHGYGVMLSEARNLSGVNTDTILNDAIVLLSK
jgi:hypothetical protein